MGSERVRIEKLKGVENWGIWKFQVKIHIEVGEALGVVDGNHVKPTLAENADAGAKSEHQKEIKRCSRRYCSTYCKDKRSCTSIKYTWRACTRRNGNYKNLDDFTACLGINKRGMEDSNKLYCETYNGRISSKGER
ncbi:uncharacterized protein [Venturia canescens]|uniref:uncharacterized protein isoform X2 n=1 Tax=Venturia canescens TaxID=32260 RepID=UPI001C9C1DB7|nr:uncharacterized protein LOC122408128 isoform X2 [Venturia canescens]